MKKPKSLLKKELEMENKYILDACCGGKCFWFNKKHPNTLYIDIRKEEKGFDECWRVLEDYGVLVFKWSEAEISVKRVLSLFSKDPLFGHTTGRAGKTKWFTFMKIPEMFNEKHS